MKWFKHISDSLDDPFIFDLIDKFGGDGYLVFFGTLEIMSREFNIKSPGICSISHKFLTKKLQLSRQKVVKILEYCHKKERIFITYQKSSIQLNCPKLKDLCDQWTQRQLSSLSVVTTAQEVEAEVEIDIKDSLSKDKGFNNKKLKTELSDKEEIQFGSAKLIREKINQVAEDLYQDKIFLKAHAFVNKMSKEKKNDRAVLQTLTQCLLKRPQNPWAYCIKIIKVENGNFNEQDHNRRNISESTR